MTKKGYLGITALIVFVIAVGGFIYWQMRTVQQLKEHTDQDAKLLKEKKQSEVVAETPIDFTKPPPGKTFEGDGHWHNGEWHDAPHKREAPPLPPSSVPDDIPEHLKFPPEWADGHYHGLEEDSSPEHATIENGERLLNMLREITRDYNPQRPLAEIWPQFIKYEKMYRARAEFDLGYTPFVGWGYNRADWQYEQAWAFPEIMEMYLDGMVWKQSPPPPGEEFKLFNTYRIEMGQLEPNWNRFTLDDGRDFFIKGETRYKFFYSGITDEGNKWERTTGFSRTGDKNAPTITVDVYNTSDEELKQLGGWDYSINPITLQPIQYEGRYIQKRKNK